MSDHFRSPPLRLPFAAALVLGLALAAPPLRDAAGDARSHYLAGRSESALETRNASAFARILGEVRATAADLMFIKTVRYLHAGVSYRPVDDAEGAAGVDMNTIDRAKRFEACAPGKTRTAISGAAEDFRGFLGDLERAVKPYRDSSEEHTHTDVAELLPWYRLMTLSNPHFIRAYRIGGAALADAHKWEESFAFMQEGVAENPKHPDLFQLYQTIASVHLRGRTHKDYPWPDAWLENSLQAARKAFELGAEQRVARDGEAWDADADEDFLYAAHIVMLLLEERGEPGDLDEAVRVGRRTLEIAPGYVPVQRTLTRLESGRDAVEKETSS